MFALKYKPKQKTLARPNLTKTLIKPPITQAIGATMPSFESINLQPKLKIGEPNDKYEQEADRIADAIIRMPEPMSTSTAAIISGVSNTNKDSGDGSTLTQRKCDDCEMDEELIQTKPNVGTTPQVTPKINAALQCNGKPLSKSAKDFFEPRFGTDFSQVRIHTGSRAAETANSINAKAFTVGKNIVFGKEQYDSDSQVGKRLLGHELTHVVQQNSNQLSKANSLFRKNSTLKKTTPVLKNHPPASLSADTPAWSESGKISLGPSFFQVDQLKQSVILNHESIHASHQQQTVEDNSNLSRKHAEAMASGNIPISTKSFSTPAPRLLAFPPQLHKPWDKVYIGNAMIMGELTQGDITLRIFLEYSDFKIKDVFKFNKDLEMDLIETPKYSVYHCGKHPNKNLDKKVKKLRKVMSKAEELNKKIPTSSTFRIKFIFISKNETERYRTANNKGILFLSSKTIDTGIVDAAAHEASHGIFEHHATAGNADPSVRTPDNLALKIVDIFTRLRATKAATLPNKKFNPKSPPPFSSKKGTTLSAGFIPVHDTVWSGAGGHPSGSVDEFFASAFAAFTQNPKLLAKIINHYNKFDKTIKPIYKELLVLFKKVGKSNALKTITSPADKKNAEDILGRISAPPDYTNPDSRQINVDRFFDPDSLPGPSKIVCKP